MRFGIMNTLGLGCLLAAGTASAHLVSTSLTIKGGESFSSGQEVTVGWTVDVLHDGKMDLAFSKDGGSTWTTVKANFAASNGANTFKWAVPNEPTTKGKFRVCLGVGSSCDNVKASSPGAAPYALVSPEFTVTGGSAIAGRAAAAEPFAIAYRPGTRNVDVSFSLAEARDVSLRAFDTQGRLLATLVQGRYEAGDHALSAFAGMVDPSAKALVFKLDLGNEVRTHTWQGR